MGKLQQRYGLVFDFAPTYFAISYNTLETSSQLKLNFVETGVSDLDAADLFQRLKLVPGAKVIIGWNGSCIAFFPLGVDDV